MDKFFRWVVASHEERIQGIVVVPGQCRSAVALRRSVFLANLIDIEVPQERGQITRYYDICRIVVPPADDKHALQCNSQAKNNAEPSVNPRSVLK